MPMSSNPYAWDIHSMRIGPRMTEMPILALWPKSDETPYQTFTRRHMAIGLRLGEVVHRNRMRRLPWWRKAFDWLKGRPVYR